MITGLAGNFNPGAGLGIPIRNRTTDARGKFFFASLLILCRVCGMMAAFLLRELDGCIPIERDREF